MRYTSFYIKNYKGIKELTLDLERQPTTNVITLVGLNESGKTTILEALDFFESGTLTGSEHTIIPKSKKSDFNDTIEVHAEIEFDVESNGKIKRFARSKGYRTLANINTAKIKLAYTYRNSVYIDSESSWTLDCNLRGAKGRDGGLTKIDIDSEEYADITEFILNHILPPIIYYEDFLFDFPYRIYLEKSDNESFEQENYRQVMNDIIDTVGEGMSLKTHIIDRIRNPKAGSDEMLEATMDQMSARVTKVVFDAWQELFDAQGKEIRLKCDIDREKDLCYMEVRLKEGTNTYQIAERSLGFKWFFTFLLFTEFRKNRKNERGEILFLLDEPASNLHSTAQQKLLKTFSNLVSGCKLIYTTHSHHLINPMWLSGAYVVRNTALDYNKEFAFDSSKTQVEAKIYKQFVTEHPEQRTYFQPILDALEHQPGLLEEVPNIILTEGKFDFYTFRYVNEVLLEGKYEDLSFYPGNSADRNSQTIAMYLAWGRDFTLLLDGDDAGVKAKARYIKEFGAAVDPYIITLQEIDASFTGAPEDLFTEDERLAITQDFDPTSTAYNKSKFNTALQQKFVDQEHKELDSQTLARFEKILGFLKQ